jgi:hypothetical protein
MTKKDTSKEHNNTTRESEYPVLPVLELVNIEEESEKGVLPVLKKVQEAGGSPTLSATGVLRIPMNTPIQYRYWLKGTTFDLPNVDILSLKEIRHSLFRKSMPTKTGS